eukprot:Hpha_TRINITY_DN17009_c0_g2::TRINITY_DN17009_c0_g2_i1::g.166068::m.166068
MRGVSTLFIGSAVLLTAAVVTAVLKRGRRGRASAPPQSPVVDEVVYDPCIVAPSELPTLGCGVHQDWRCQFPPASPDQRCGVVIRMRSGSDEEQRMIGDHAARLKAWVPWVPRAVSVLPNATLHPDLRPVFHEVVQSGDTPSSHPFERSLVLAPGVATLQPLAIPRNAKTRVNVRDVIEGALDLLRWFELLAPPAADWDFETRMGPDAEAPLQARVLFMRRSPCTARLGQCWVSRLKQQHAECFRDRSAGLHCGLRAALRMMPVKYATVSHIWHRDLSSRPGHRPSPCLDAEAASRGQVDGAVLYDDVAHEED